MINPANPKTIRMQFLHTDSVKSIPLGLSQCVHMSIIAGNAMPNAERHSAPKSDMKSSNFGTAIANKTATKKYFIV